MIPQIRLQPDTLVVIDGAHHKVLSRDDAGVTLRTMGERPVTVVKTHQELADLYFATPRRLRLIAELAAGLPEGVRANLERQIEGFDVAYQDEALRRLDYVQGFDRAFAEGTAKKTIAGFASVARSVAAERRRLQAELEEADPETLGVEKVGGSTLQKWYRRWRKAGRSMAALVPLEERKGGAGPKIDPEVDAVIARRIREDWLTPEQLPLAHVVRFIQDDVRRLNESRVQPLDVPSASTVRRWVARNVAKFDEVYHREGKAAAEELFRHVKAAPKATRPLQVVEVDHTPLDVLLVHGDGALAKERNGKRTKRVWLTVAICTATRMIVGFHISDVRPSWTSVMHCLRMAVLPKDLAGIRVQTSWPVFGVPEVVKLDNGREFHSRSMKAAAGQLRFELRYMPRRRPHLKGIVERVLGTIARDFCAYLPGRTFRDVRERGDYDSVGRAALTLAQLVELFTIWVVDIYHNRPHGGLLGRTPLQRWTDLQGYGVRLPPSAEDLTPLIALVVPRTIQRSGITFLGLRYQSDLLRGIRRRKGFHFGDEFLVKVDPADLGHVLVLLEDEGRWESIRCEDHRLADGVSLQEWRDTVEVARRMTSKDQRVSQETLVKAMRLLREEGRLAGAKPVRLTQIDVDWFREHVDDPMFDLAADPADADTGHREERLRARLPAGDDEEAGGTDRPEVVVPPAPAPAPVAEAGTVSSPLAVATPFPDADDDTDDEIDWTAE
ncbi:Mu transposase C-terminal domain-containing protein [Salinarimonas soli]|uniref:DDE-type integrase/transposase/recombinase n=1 Tax=Salinarimonas soli TaxID=1638099 RepID=A0A5B2VAP4_9HYPH|nr:DDE-type integrase/transposase/recombinase [Salinarimonas soli]KAA2235866.1 DDE-type integrase/transposase/recombinase [Salinarimonas soli]